MKRFVGILLSLGLCHCSLGTEVGNGVKPTTGAATSGSAPTVNSDGTTTEADTATNSSMALISPYFFVACASPFAETAIGSFAHATNSGALITVTPSADGTFKTLKRFDGVVIYEIKPQPTVSPYAIDRLLGAADVTCGAVSSQTLADGTIERSVTLSDGAQLSWILSERSLLSMKVVKDSFAEFWTKIAL